MSDQEDFFSSDNYESEKEDEIHDTEIKIKEYDENRDFDKMQKLKKYAYLNSIPVCQYLDYGNFQKFSTST